MKHVFSTFVLLLLIAGCSRGDKPLEVVGALEPMGWVENEMKAPPQTGVSLGATSTPNTTPVPTPTYTIEGTNWEWIGVFEGVILPSPTYCEITFPVCRAFPNLSQPGYIRRDYYRDISTGKLSITDRQTCFNRAVDFVSWCQNLPGEPVMAHFFDGVTKQVHSRVNAGCMIFPESCPQYPANSGVVFRDGDSLASNTPTKCALRAKDYAGWCRTPGGYSVSSTFYDTYGFQTRTVFKVDQ